ncbi:MAG: alkaline phosphatase family protein [Anaerolineales bacterium]|nr:alkaline phosphatase family protein [Anaerolineales bacterium]
MPTHSPFIRPCYDSTGFASLPGRLTDLLTCGRYDTVVLFLVDGFGWRFFEQFQDGPFLRPISQLADFQVEKLTSQFPSTTSAHLTTLHTGQTVGEHGLFEWYLYEPDLDAVIAPLLFSLAGTAERETLWSAGVDPARIYPARTIYPDLSGRGVTATIFQPREYTPSTYSNAIYRGAAVRGYKGLPEALVNLAGALGRPASPAYFVFYYDRIDGTSHEYGPTASQTEAEILNFLLAMEHIFLRNVCPAGRTLFLFCADHGQVETDPETAIYINRDPRFAGVEKFLRTDRAGAPLVPAGACRDFFLYIKDGLVEEARDFLATRLTGRAEVRAVAQMTAEGWFGPRVSDRFRARAGDLVILPYRGESVWWYEQEKFIQRNYGHHGGLTPQEMEIPLLQWEV